MPYLYDPHCYKGIYEIFLWLVSLCLSETVVGYHTAGHINICTNEISVKIGIQLYLLRSLRTVAAYYGHMVVISFLV